MKSHAPFVFIILLLSCLFTAGVVKHCSEEPRHDTIDCRSWSTSSHSVSEDYERFITVKPVPTLVFHHTSDTVHPAVIRDDEEADTLEWEQKVYSRDSLYRVWISGYEAELDSIEYYQKVITVSDTTFIYKETTLQKKQSPWSLGVTFGLAATQHGIGPGVTLGVTYTYDIKSIFKGKKKKKDKNQWIN